MKEKNRFSKPVAFNSRNEKDCLILEHVKRRNFSGYVKKLILADIESRKAEKPHIEPLQAIQDYSEPSKPKTNAERLEEMKKRTQKSGNINPPAPNLFIK